MTYWAELKSIFPNLLLLLRQNKSFKRLFFPVFNIAEKDVVYFSGGWPLTKPPESFELLPGPAAYPLPNIILFPPGQYMNDVLLDQRLFSATLTSFFEEVRRFSFAGHALSPERRVLILPRGKKENFAPNDRLIPEFDILLKLAEGVAGVDILRTDEVLDIRQQVRAVSQAKVLFVASGSAAYFNALFCRNATIYTLGVDRLRGDMLNWPYARLVRDIAYQQGNKIEIRDGPIQDGRVPVEELRLMLMSAISA